MKGVPVLETAVPDEVLRFSESRLRAGIEARPIIALRSGGDWQPDPNE